VSLWSADREAERVEVAPGAVWLRGCLTPCEQLSLATAALALLDGPGGGYVPTVRGGGRMHVRMMCLGRHWNALTYTYVSARDDFDGQPVAAIPAAWQALAERVAHVSGFACHPDICIVNHYPRDGRMGLHQDRGESAHSLGLGLPVVSLSIGATARFLFGGHSRRDRPQALMLESGDAFVFGGPARLRFHGVSRIVDGTAPAGLPLGGRLNFTFRQY
jgi:DNA alkylation damage repair protein AlkB